MRVMRKGIIAAARLSAAGGGGYTGPLDIVPGAVVAYSQRAMTADSTVNAITIRRDSDDATQTFALTANAVDAAAVTAFLGAANGFVSTWFDQSGNAIDGAQATLATQPAWLASALNSKPGITFDSGIPQRLVGGPISLTNGFTTFAVIKLADTTNTFQSVWGWYVNPSYSSLYVNGSVDPPQASITANDDSGNGTSLANIDISPNLASGFVLLDGLITSTEQNLYANGVLQGTGSSVSVATSTSTFIAIGDDETTADFPFGGSIVEILIYEGGRSDGDRLAIRQNIADHYGISIGGGALTADDGSTPLTADDGTTPLTAD